jgi:hypothetical protein
VSTESSQSGGLWLNFQCAVRKAAHSRHADNTDQSPAARSHEAFVREAPRSSDGADASPVYGSGDLSDSSALSVSQLVELSFAELSTLPSPEAGLPVIGSELSLRGLKSQAPRRKKGKRGDKCFVMMCVE